MDRRRFLPSADALEARMVLSGLNHSSVPLANLHQKTVRIENLGKVLNSLQPHRVVPTDIVAAIQTDLRAIVGRLDPASPALLTAAERQFRSTLATASISTADAAGLRDTFRNAIQSTGAPKTTLDDLVANTDKLVQLDSTGRNPSLLAANDYAVVLQTVLGVGRPIQKPGAPKLSPTDDTGIKGDHKTTVTQPHLVGAYDAGSTIHLLDETGQVIGTTTATATGSYSVAPTSPLSVGRHALRVSAIDVNGDPSPPSLPVTVIIYASRVRTQVTTPGAPGGPLGL